MPGALTTETASDLLAREAELRAARGSLRMRDAAAALGAPEAALLEARRSTGEVVRLTRPDGAAGFGEIIARLPEAGELMALTRNESCVHESKGRYSAPEISGAVGQVVGDIDLRIFLQHWRHGYAFTEPTEAGPRLSLQFFDAAGDAVHKVYPIDGTDRAALQTIVRDFATPDAAPAAFAARQAPASDGPDAGIDVAALRAGWSALEHTHRFVGMLRRLSVGRAQAMRLAGPDFARPVHAGAARRILTEAAAAGLPIMIFVGNDGCVQIHSGPVFRIEAMGPWVNVLDPRFNLHLREDRIDAAYVVRKPSVNGDIHSLEMFDAAGVLIAQIFGHRAAGGVEREDWRACLANLDAAPC